MNDPINNYRSVSLMMEQAKIQVQDDQHPVSKRIQTQHVSNGTFIFTKSEQKSLNYAQNPTVESALINQSMPLSQRLHISVEKLIEDEITKGKLSVPQFASPIKLQIKMKKQQNSPDSQNDIKQKMKEIQDKRQQTLIMLKSIQNQQIQIKRQSVSFKFNQQALSRSRIKKQRSHYSPQQKRAVKKMLQRKNILQKQIDQKTINFKKRNLLEVQTQRQRYQTEIEKQQSLHRSFIEEKKPLIEEKKLQRFKSIESGKKKYQQIKNKRYYYQALQEKDEKLALQELQEFNKKLQNIKSKMRVTIVQELKEHKSKYNQIMKSRTQAYKINKKNDFINEPQVKRYEDNYFTKLVKQEREQKRKQTQMTKSKLFELKKKAKQFSQHCEIEIRQKIKITSKSKFVPVESTKSTFALNYQEQLKKGNQYLTAAKKLKKCETLEDQKVLSGRELQIKQKKSHKPLYKNYLTEIRRLSQPNPQENDRKKFSNFLQKQGSISEYTVLQKAFVKAQSIQAISKKSNNQKLIDAVQNKIQLLKMIM